MKTLEYQEKLEMLKNLIFIGLISADNDEYSEDIKQQIISRHNECPNDWGYILAPLDSVGNDKEKYLKILGS